MSKKDDALKKALEAFERCVATCFDRYAHEQVMSRPEHFVNQAITAIRDALTEQPAQRQEPVSWDRFMSVEKELQDMTAEFIRVAKELAALKTQQQEPVAYLYHDARTPKDAHPWLHSTMLVLAAERRPGLRGETPLYPSPPAQRTWVGLTDEERHACTQSPFSADNYRAIEAKLREKNNG